jgi:serine/threonine protein kinase
MALSKQRIHAGGESPYAHEREAIAYVLEQLDDRDPFQAWPLQEFVDRSTGDLLEVDLIVCAPNALYLVEVKSYPDGAKLAGDAMDWRWQAKGESNWRYIPNPLRSTNRKAKVLKSLLGRELDHVWVEALVFVSSKGLDTNRLESDGRNHVVFRQGIEKALSRAEYPGAAERLQTRRIDRPTAKAIAKQLATVGIRAARRDQRFGSYVPQGEIERGPGYQEYLAFHSALAKNQDSAKARLRVYRQPSHDNSREHQDRLQQIAKREFQNLYQLRDCAHVLQARDFCENSVSHEPAIAFEAFDGGAPFSSFLRQNPDLSFEARLSVVEQVANALHACHRKEVLHRGLHPGCVLVREPQDGQKDRLEVRVAGFQHARDFDASTLQTLHATDLESPDFLIYRAPELLGGNDSGSPESDVFSLAAFAYFAFTGQHPAATPDELVRTLRDHDGLRPGLVQDDLTLLDPIFQTATHAEYLRRPSPIEFCEQLENALTAPGTEHSLADPRSARAEEQLEGGFTVVRELGRGSSARVLEILDQDGQHDALKVPIDESREELLRNEADVLRQLEHHGVVRLLDVVRPSGVTCLRLRLADPETLGDRLRQKGPLSLDLARRYGIDLLDTLKYLEQKGITHRDIKPHNVGFSREVDKKESRLLLFDFSLSPVDATKVALGTVAYRDPWLPDRKAWDAAADRYSAAVTLHELLTGVRPDYGEGIHPASVRNPKPRIDGSRFDGSVREGLVAFFEKALAAVPAARHESADDMRFEWESAFRAPQPVARPAAAPETPTRPTAEQAPVRPFDLEAELKPDTPLAAFVSAPLLLDALERGGAVTALDVARLPRNRLSAVPGIGKETQTQVLTLITALRARFEAVLAQQEPMLSSFRLPPEPLLSLPRDLLPKEALERLHKAGIRTTAELAAAAPDQVDRILEPAKLKATKVRRHLEAYQEQAGTEGAAPTTLGGWLDLLLTAGKLDAKRNKTGALQLTKTKRAGWAWLGLTTDDDDANRKLHLRSDDPLRTAARTGEIATALDVSQPTVSNAIGKARDQWQSHPHKDALVKLVQDTLDELGGAASLPDAATRLLRTLRPTGAQASPSAEADSNHHAHLRSAGALLRIASLLPDSEGRPALELGKHHDQTWCASTEAHLEAAAKLGQKADQLVGSGSTDGAPIPAFTTARQTLEDAVRHLLPKLPAPDTLFPLAARASRHTACSRKLELYRRGLAAPTALNLARAAVQAALPAHATPDDAVPAERVRDLVRERYPEAAELPDHPELDQLLEPYGLVWSDKAQGYTRRPEETAQPTIQRTRPSRTITTSTDNARVVPSERELRARAFEDRLRLAVENRRFRLIQCLDTEYDDTIRALSEFLAVDAISFDRLLIEQMDRAAAKLKVDPELILRTDRQGDPRATGAAAATMTPPKLAADWKNLCGLAGRAADALLPAVVGDGDAPRLIVHLGLLARYELSSFLDRWLRTCEEGDGPAVFAVVPSEQGDDPTIDGRLPVPLTAIAAQRLWVDADWLARRRPSTS